MTQSDKSPGYVETEVEAPQEIERNDHEGKKTKRPRTLGRYSKEQHAEAEKREWALVHVEVNDAYMNAEGSNISIHGPASSKFAAAIREIMRSYNKGFFDDPK